LAKGLAFYKDTDLQTNLNILYFDQMNASFKYYLLCTLLGFVVFPALGQWPDKEHLAPDSLLRMWYTDSCRKTALNGTTIELPLKDRHVSGHQSGSFEVLLELHNISRKTLIVPDLITCYDDSGFGSNNFDIGRGVPLQPGKTQKISLMIPGSQRRSLNKSGYMKVYVAGGDYVLYPIHLSVRYVFAEDSVQLNRQ